MGTVFGRESVAEPPYSVLLSRQAVECPYEIRKYSERVAIEASYPTGADGESNDGTPFMMLARYIGVVGAPENEGAESISMTAPVVIERKEAIGGGTPISMTAPVVKSNEGGVKKMQFILPTKFDEVSKAPKPTNPGVQVKKLPASVGVVHRFNGNFSEERSRTMAMGLAKQLREDGLDMSDEDVLGKFQFWGYNPPFTIPYFRRNEVWVPMSQQQVSRLVNSHGPSSIN